MHVYEVEARLGRAAIEDIETAIVNAAAVADNDPQAIDALTSVLVGMLGGLIAKPSEGAVERAVTIAEHLVEVVRDTQSA